MARDESVPLCYKGSMPLLNDLLMETTLEKISSQEKTRPEAMPYNLAKKPYNFLVCGRDSIPCVRRQDSCGQAARNCTQIHSRGDVNLLEPY